MLSEVVVYRRAFMTCNTEPMSLQLQPSLQTMLHKAYAAVQMQEQC